MYVREYIRINGGLYEKKKFNNYYIKTLVRLSKELGCYDEVNNNIKVIFDCIKSTEKPFFPHVILGEMKFNSFSQKMSL